jgi:hypothetical protein
VFFFSRNGEYFGGTTLEQEPLYTAQIHATYNLGRGVWAALSGTYDYGGRTTVGGVENNDAASNSRFGATLALPVDRRNSLKLYMSGGVHTRTGTDYTLYGAIWQHRWGEGL